MNDKDIDPKIQKILNEPLIKDDGLSDENRAFLDLITAKIDGGEIDLHKPGSLINHSVYDKLSEEQCGKVDFDAYNLLTTIRTIYELWKNNPAQTYQIENMVQQVRQTKERFENISGDVYIV